MRVASANGVDIVDESGGAAIFLRRWSGGLLAIEL